MIDVWYIDMFVLQMILSQAGETDKVYSRGGGLVYLVWEGWGNLQCCDER